MTFFLNKLSSFNCHELCLPRPRSHVEGRRPTDRPKMAAGLAEEMARVEQEEAGIVSGVYNSKKTIKRINS